MTDHELSNLLQEWKRTPAPPSLSARVFALRRLPAPNWWDRIPGSLIAVGGAVAGGLMVVLLVTWAPKQSVQTAAAPVAQPVTVEQTAVEPATVEQVKPRVTAPPVKAPVAKKPEAPAAESPSTAAPKLLSGPTPAYPIDAPPLTVATTLKVRIRVGKDGRVIDASVIDGDPLLNSIALEAVRTWTYEPLVLNGVPMEATIETDVVFEPIRKKK